MFCNVLVVVVGVQSNYYFSLSNALEVVSLRKSLRMNLIEVARNSKISEVTHILSSISHCVYNIVSVVDTEKMLRESLGACANSNESSSTKSLEKREF